MSKTSFHTQLDLEDNCSTPIYIFFTVNEISCGKKNWTFDWQNEKCLQTKRNTKRKTYWNRKHRWICFRLAHKFLTFLTMFSNDFFNVDCWNDMFTHKIYTGCCLNGSVHHWKYFQFEQWSLDWLAFLCFLTMGWFKKNEVYVCRDETRWKLQIGQQTTNWTCMLSFYCLKL